MFTTQYIFIFHLYGMSNMNLPQRTCQASKKCKEFDVDFRSPSDASNTNENMRIQVNAKLARIEN